MDVRHECPDQLVRESVTLTIAKASPWGKREGARGGLGVVLYFRSLRGGVLPAVLEPVASDPRRPWLAHGEENMLLD